MRPDPLRPLRIWKKGQVSDGDLGLAGNRHQHPRPDPVGIPIVFNIAVGNRDDHLRNHGFILGPDGWRLAPAYDVNPNPDKAEHAIAIDESNPTPDLGLAMETCAYYQLDAATASGICAQVLHAVSGWRTVAQRSGIPRSEVELMERVFTTEAR